MYILGISAFYHDSAAALIYNGKILAAAQEERFTRIKNDASFPVNAIKFCLEFAGCSVNELTAIAFYDKPFLKFERLLETYHAYAPKGLRSFLVSMPVWLREKLFMKKVLKDSMNSIEKVDWKKVKLLFPEHHLSHAASAFYPSGFEKAAILTIDGVGEWATTSINLGERNNIRVLKELRFPHSLGLLYSAFTYYLGFEVNSGEYKVMGLAPYGNSDSGEVQKFKQIIEQTLLDIKEDGSFFIDQRYFTYATGLKMVNDKKWEELFGIPRRKKDDILEQQHCDLALAVQQVTEEIMIKLATHAKALTGADYLCMAGGVALNGVAAGKLDNKKIFKKIFIQPAAGDGGGALGAAYAAHYIYYQKQRHFDTAGDEMQGCYLGPVFTESDILGLTRKHNGQFEIINEEDILIEKVADLLAKGKVVGWFQGRTEFGPRALGSRSILADARDPQMQKKLNIAIKFREGFRPFAPVIPLEEVHNYFEHDGESPYMMFVKSVNKERIKLYPEAYNKMSMQDKLAFIKSNLPSVTHVDYTARIQTVDQSTNKRLWKLLHAFKNLTGYPVLINTSFNIKDEPIVNSPVEAYNCFMSTGMDHLVAGNVIFSK